MVHGNVVRNRQLRISDKLWYEVGALGKELLPADDRGLHSPMIRELVSAGVGNWRESPYVCRPARLITLVTRDGHVVYHLAQDLKLNYERLRLPCVLEMKPEKRLYFLRSRPSHVDQAEWLRSRWLLNHFAAWYGEGEARRLLDRQVDRLGMESKTADLVVDMPDGRTLTREITACIQDYVQWQEQGRGKDRVDLPIDIPTRDLEATVIVDLELYRNSGSEAEIADLGLEFRNREGARCAGEELANDEENSIKGEAGRFSDDDKEKMSPEAALAAKSLLHLDEHVRRIAFSTDDNKSLLTAHEGEQVLAALKMPRHFLFYHLTWPSPHFGIEVCVRFEKPIRWDRPAR